MCKKFSGFRSSFSSGYYTVPHFIHSKGKLFHSQQLIYCLCATYQLFTCSSMTLLLLQQDLNVKFSSKDFLQEMIICYDIISSEDLGNENVRRTNTVCFANNKCTCTSNMYVIHYAVFHEYFFSTQVYISKVPIYLVEILRNSCSALVCKWIQKINLILTFPTLFKSFSSLVC